MGNKKQEINILGRVVRLITPNGVSNGRIGDIAIIVNGKEEFPKLYTALLAKLNNEKKQMDEFIWVKWIADHPYRPTFDGAYHKNRFELISVKEKNV